MEWHKGDWPIYRHVVKSQIFYWSVITLVFLNTACVASEHYGQPEWFTEFLKYAEYIFLAIFLCEVQMISPALTNN